MSAINIQVKPSFRKLGSAFQLIRLGAALQRAISRYAFAIREGSVIETPVDTGRLRASIMVNLETLRAVIAPHTKYAEWIHEGKRFDPRSGRMVYIKGKGRAGTPPGGKPYMRLGLEKAERQRDRIIDKELRGEIIGSFRRLGVRTQ